MARSINSPGVQITETDLSTNIVPVVGTNVYVMGFADQGPTDETLLVTSISEWETIYGVPRTTAEQYFYHTCKEILNSPATLLTTRLPYGSAAGEGFDEQYSMLLYPVASSDAGFQIGTPIHRVLSDAEYADIIQGNLTWVAPASGTSVQTLTSISLSSVTATSQTSAATFAAIQAVDPTPETFSVEYLGVSSVKFTFQVILTSTTTFGTGIPSYTGNIVDAGIIVLNKSQTTINENYEGYYLALTDNRNVDAGSDFTSVNSFNTITNNNGTFVQLGENRLQFTLSASNEFAGTGSVSEIIEGVPTFNFADEYFKDSLILTLFKVRRSIYEPDLLSIRLAESHIGSLDSRKKNLLNTSAFLEDVVNNNSNNLTILVNPSIKNTLWTGSLSSVNPLKSVTSDNNALYANGVYSPGFQAAVTKETGSITDKVRRALTNVESNETINLDLVIDGGLTTIHANTETKKFYNDAEYVDRSDLASSNSQAVNRWRGLFSIFDNFAKNTRKDCMFIADPLRQIFVNGINTKTTSLKGSNFTSTIYNPLKNLVNGLNSNYSAIYGNWVKGFDTFVDRSIWLPPSGFMAAIYARVDEAANPWIAPAGLNRGIINNVLDLAFNPNQKQRDFLYTISVNPLVFFSGDGFTVFGQKTLQAKPSAFDRINVRRLFLTLEKSVLRTVKYFVFEPNTTFTRSRVVNTLSPIFENAKNTEGLYDYRIICDERNNTPDVIDANELKIDIYIKPVRAAEFILVNFIATRTGQDFEELI
jgi:hypothetical protein